MKMLAEYLEKAIAFERMAADEKDAKLKAGLGKTGCGLSEARGATSETIQARCAPQLN